MIMAESNHAPRTPARDIENTLDALDALDVRRSEGVPPARQTGRDTGRALDALRRAALVVLAVVAGVGAVGAGWGVGALTAAAPVGVVASDPLPEPVTIETTPYTPTPAPSASPTKETPMPARKVPTARVTGDGDAIAAVRPPAPATAARVGTPTPTASPTAQATTAPATKAVDDPPVDDRPVWTQDDQDAADAWCVSRHGEGSTTSKAPTVGERYTPIPADAHYACTSPR